MNPRTALASLILVPALLLNSACQASSGSAKAESTAMSMDGLQKAIETLKAKVNAAAGSLATVVEKGGVDPKGPFEQYKKDVEAVVDGLSKAESNLKSIRSQGAKYFAEWEKQASTIKDEDLKKTAQERRARLSKAIEDVSTAMDAAREEIKPFVTSIQDVQTYLSNDLTPAGIESIGGKSKQVSKSADSIGDKLDDVYKALQKGAPEFKMAKPPPPPPATKK
jgi:chromosome segregation ATPase